MKYSARYSNKFKKDMKRCEKRGYNTHLLRDAISLLCETGTLPPFVSPTQIKRQIRRSVGMPYTIGLVNGMGTK